MEIASLLKEREPRIERINRIKEGGPQITRIDTDYEWIGKAN